MWLLAGCAVSVTTTTTRQMCIRRMHTIFSLTPIPNMMLVRTILDVSNSDEMDEQEQQYHPSP